MPIRAGVSAAAMRVGSLPVLRAYAGSSLVSGGSSTQPPAPPQPPTPPTPPPTGAHAAPTAMSAIAGSGSASLSWSSISGPTEWLVQYSTNGSTWYEIPSGGVAFSSPPAATGSVTLSVLASVSGLANGTAYTFRAASKIGSTWSGYSASSQFATPAAPAAAPENLTVDVPSGSPYLRVTWDGGATQSAANTPSGYDLEKSSDDGVTWTPAGSWLIAQEQAQQMFVWGYGYVRPNDNIGAATGSFLPSTAYKFRLRRTRYTQGTPPSLAGSPILPASAWETTSTAATTPTAAPGQPRGISAEPFSGGIAVSFVEPYFPGSSAIASYKIGRAHV